MTARSLPRVSSRHDAPPWNYAPALAARTVRDMPIAQMLRQTAPFAAVLHHKQEGVKQLQIGHADVAALPRQTIRNPLKLTLG